MSKKYFFNDGKKQLGPLSFEELTKLSIKDDDNIWVEGADDWRKASEYEELRPFMIKLPPPLSKKKGNYNAFIASEIKVILRLIFIAFLVGIIAYPIIAYFEKGFQSLSLKRDYTNVIKEYSGGEDAVITDTFSTEALASDDYTNWNRKKESLEDKILNTVPSEDKEYFTIAGSNYLRYPESLDNNIKRAFGIDTIWLSILCFISTSVIFVSSRYIYKVYKKSSNWIKLNSTKINEI